MWSYVKIRVLLGKSLNYTYHLSASTSSSAKWGPCLSYLGRMNINSTTALVRRSANCETLKISQKESVLLPCKGVDFDSTIHKGFTLLRKLNREGFEKGVGGERREGLDN